MPQERDEEGVSAGGGQWVEAELGVVGLRAPAVLVFGTVIDQQEDTGGGQAVEQTVQGRLGLGTGMGPEHQQLRCRAGFVEKETAEHLVVGGDLIVPGDQGGPARPVQVEQVGWVQRGHRRTVGQDLAGADREPGGAELAREIDQHPDDRSVFRHRT